MVLALIRLFTPVYGEDPSDDGTISAKHPDKVDVLLDALKDIIFLLDSFGKDIPRIFFHFFKFVCFQN